MPFTTLQTARLRLRPPRLEDASAIYEGYARDAEVSRYVVWVPHRSIDETRAFLSQYVEEGSRTSVYPWVVVRAGDDQLLGTIRLSVRPPRSEVGYNLARSEWGKGYGTEALQAVVDFALALPAVFRIQAVCHVENRASARVMEKVGMIQEGTLRRYMVFPNLGADPQDVWLYAKTTERDRDA